MIERHLEKAGADVRQSLSGIPARAFPSKGMDSKGSQWFVFAVSFSVVLAIGVAVGVLTNQSTVTTFPPATTPSGAMCIEPPEPTDEGGFIWQRDLENYEMGVTPSMVHAGARAVLSIRDIGIDTASSPVATQITFLECWTETGWEPILNLVKGTAGIAPAVRPLNAWEADLFGLSFPLVVEILIPDIAPGTYLLRDYLASDDGQGVQAWTLVTVLGPNPPTTTLPSDEPTTTKVAEGPTDTSPHVVEQDGLYLLVGTWDGGPGELAMIAGVVTVSEGGCIGIGGGDLFYPLVWPAGSQFAPGQMVGVEVPESGTFHVGDSIEAGGGFGPARGPAFSDGCEASPGTEMAVVQSKIRRIPESNNPTTGWTCPDETHGNEPVIVESAFPMTLSSHSASPGTILDLHIGLASDLEAASIGVANYWQCWNGTKWVDSHLLHLGITEEGGFSRPSVVPWGESWVVRLPAFEIPRTVRVMVPDVPPGTYRIRETIAYFEDRNRPAVGRDGFVMIEVQAPR